MSKLQKLIATVSVFLLMTGAFVFAEFVLIGCVADLATTVLGKWPYIWPTSDTVQFRTNMTILFCTEIAAVAVAYVFGCRKFGAWAGRNW